MLSTTDTRLSTHVASDVMRRPLITCDPTADLATVAALMAREQVHCIAVDGSTHEHAADPLEWEFVTDLDVVRAAATGSARQPVGALATGRALMVSGTEDLDAVAAILAENDATHAMVLEGGEPVGMLSGLDLVHVLAGASPSSAR